MIDSLAAVLRLSGLSLRARVAAVPDRVGPGLAAWPGDPAIVYAMLASNAFADALAQPHARRVHRSGRVRLLVVHHGGSAPLGATARQAT
ncbi:hypothetical protein [Actinoallomurus acaciae]|uniref:Uncharacterized protein n=1 Tax=Actinoallomurus acaciae TaxID=502577 RepID=A0ABV5YBU6_9ACTN